ncbi:hypothetical protein FQZ97_1091380 [compost metagenome]
MKTHPPGLCIVVGHLLKIRLAFRPYGYHQGILPEIFYREVPAFQRYQGSFCQNPVQKVRLQCIQVFHQAFCFHRFIPVQAHPGFGFEDPLHPLIQQLNRYFP